MTQRRKEAVTAAVIVLIIAVIIVLACAFYDAGAFGANPIQWTPIGPFSGGINVTANKGQLSQGELLDARNFIWVVDNGRDARSTGTSTGHLEVREGFYRFAGPESGRAVEFIDLFRSPSGPSYLIYSDGTDLWYRTNLTGPAVALSFGRANAGTVSGASGQPYVHGNTLASQKWRTIFGNGYGQPMIINGVTYTVRTFLLDTLVQLTTNLASTVTTVSYDLDYTNIDVRSGYQVNNNYWIFTNVGKFQFISPTEFVIVDSLVGTRYDFTATARYCLGSIPTQRFTVGAITENFGGKFARLVTNPLSQGSANPITADSAFYMTIPVYSSGSGYLYGLTAAFQYKAASAQKLTIKEMSVDTSSILTIVIDSLELLASDSSGSSCSGNQALYFEAHCDTCNFTKERFNSGDWFASPKTVTTEIGVSDVQTANGIMPTYNTIIAAKVTTPNQQAIKAYRLSVWGFSTYSGVTAMPMKGAIYRATDSTLVDTTLTLSQTYANSPYVQVDLNFAEGVDLAASSVYFVCVWADSNFFQAYNRNLSGLYSFSKALDYTGSFPGVMSGWTTSSREYRIWLDCDYYDAAAPLLTSAINCLPVVGGWVTGDSSIYIAVASSNQTKRMDYSMPWSRMRDRDTTRLTLFRMVGSVPASAEGLEWTIWHNSVNFEVRSNYRDRLYWSEVNLPDSFMIDHMMIVDHGNPLIAGGKQLGDLVVYTATNRWKILYGGGGQYTKQFLDGVRGCVARRSFLDIEGVHYGLGSDGFWESSGEAPQLISQAVQSYFTDSLDWTRLNDVAAGYDAELDNIWISQKDRFCLVYNRGSRSWWPQSFIAGAYTYNPDIAVSDSVRFICGGADSSGLFVRGGTEDDGDSIDAIVQTAYMDFGAAEYVKEMRGVRFGYESDRALTFTIGSFRGMSSSQFDDFDLSLSSGWSEKWIRFYEGRYRGKYLSHKLTFYGASGLKVPWVKVQVEKGVEE